ncbi:StbB family protein [Photobacterium indicum]|uniref:StbB family protein n=1 Tax=Photobacterium indicum TaxID=81447 RepID=UPI003D0FE33D
MFLKIAVLNNSGNVGKSMICENLFLPRIPNVEILKIETINSDGTNDTKLSAKSIGEIFKRMESIDTCIIDIGSSNIETFMGNLDKIEGSIEDIDLFFIPTTPKQKQQRDTLTTIENLFELGVEPDQIKIIFNLFDPDFSIEKQFPIIIGAYETKDLTLNNPKNQFIIEESQLFEFLGETNKTYAESLNDSRDFKSLLRATKDKEERENLSVERMTHRFVKGFDKKLDLTFNNIIKACNIVIEE